MATDPPTGLPPGQRALPSFPRFGVDLSHPPPAVPADLSIEVVGELSRAVSISPADLTQLPRRTVRADFHCVAGWSARGLTWTGVPFAELFRLRIEPALSAGTTVRFLVFVGLDGYRSIVTIEDALADGVLLADQLDGQPLSPEHGAPVRLVSPEQYGYLNTKHLRRIELYRSEPVNLFHPNKTVQRALLLVRPHPRGRVRHEERHRFLPSRLTRLIYRLVRSPR